MQAVVYNFFYLQQAVVQAAIHHYVQAAVVFVNL